MVIQECDCNIKRRIGEIYGETAYNHCLLGEEGSTFVAIRNDFPVGFISTKTRHLPTPLEDCLESFIWIIEVHSDHRRNGIGKELVSIAVKDAKKKGCYQIGAWSSEDKKEAIPMWKALGFGLCPTTIYPKGNKVNGFFVAKPLQYQNDT